MRDWSIYRTLSGFHGAGDCAPVGPWGSLEAAQAAFVEAASLKISGWGEMEAGQLWEPQFVDPAMNWVAEVTRLIADVDDCLCALERVLITGGAPRSQAAHDLGQILPDFIGAPPVITDCRDGDQ